MKAEPVGLVTDTTLITAHFEPVWPVPKIDLGGAGLCPTQAAIAALCIDGMVVARSMNDRSHGDQLRDAAINAALELGSWTRSKARPNIKREPRRKKQSASTYSSVT